jgi:hypothetical protein
MRFVVIGQVVLELFTKNIILGLTLYDNPASTDFDLGTLRWTFETFDDLFEF